MGERTTITPARSPRSSITTTERHVTKQKRPVRPLFLLRGAVYNLPQPAALIMWPTRRWGMDDSEFLKLLTHIHDEMLELVKEQHPSHEQIADWLLGQIEGHVRTRDSNGQTGSRTYMHGLV